MSKTIVVGGYGPGISNAVAEKFGAEGFSVAIVGRNEKRLAEGEKSLAAKGVHAAAFPADLAEPKSVERMIAAVRQSLGPITVLEWTAYARGAGDLLEADDAAIHGVLDVATIGLLTAVRAALPDLRADPSSAVLVANGGFAFSDPKVNTMAVQFNSMGLALANAAKRKLVGLLAEKLRGDGIYVGEIVVVGTVKGSAFDTGHGNLDPKIIADKFWEMYRARRDVSVTQH